MKNINQLERDKKEVLLNMNKDEIMAYFDNISKKQIATYPKITKEGITEFNYNEYKKLDEILDESIRIIGSKYNNIKFFPIHSKYIELNELYDENLIMGNVLFLERILFIVYHFVKSIQKDLYLLEEHLTLSYFRYFFKFHDIKEVLKIADVPEEQIKAIQDLFIKENPELFNTPIEDTFNIFIESIVEDLEENIELLKKYDNYEEDSLEALRNLTSKGYPEVIIEVHESIYNLIAYGNDLIELYEELKANPFSEGNEIIIEEYVNVVFDENISDLDSFEESLTDEKDIRIFNCLKEGFSSDVPKYDFKEFRIILPERDEEK